MPTERSQRIWQGFDDLARQAPDPATKLIIEAIRLHAELMNRGLSLIEQQLIVVRGSGNH